MTGEQSEVEEGRDRRGTEAGRGRGRRGRKNIPQKKEDEF
jgi:hypothetical protein